MTTVRITPYLHFKDQAREAMTFYQEVFGGDLTMQTYKDLGMSGHPANDDRIMHSQLVTPHGLLLMGSDVPDGIPYEPGTSMSISLSGDDEPTLRSLFDGLAEDGTVVEDLQQAPWGDHFGMCVDRFGASWMVNVSSSPS